MRQQSAKGLQNVLKLHPALKPTADQDQEGLKTMPITLDHSRATYFSVDKLLLKEGDERSKQDRLGRSEPKIAKYARSSQSSASVSDFDSIAVFANFGRMPINNRCYRWLSSRATPTRNG